MEVIEEQDSLIKWFNRHIDCSQYDIVDSRQLPQIDADVGRMRCLLEVKICWWMYTNKQFNRISLTDICKQVLKYYNQRWLCAINKLRTLKSIPSPLDYLSNKIAVASFQFNEPLQQLTIELLSVILFLDKAKQARLIKNDPCLFQFMESDTSTGSLYINSSRLLLARLLTLVLTPESIIHVQAKLKSIQFKLDYVEPEVEFEMNILDVKRLSCDLCDGFRLAKLLQNLFREEHVCLISKLKYPANKFKDKVSNMKLVMTQIKPVIESYDPNWSRKINIDTLSNEISLGYKQTTIGFLHYLINLEHKIHLKCRYKPNLDLIVFLQRKIRAFLLKRKIRAKYLLLLSKVIFVQKTYRRKLLANRTRIRFLLIKQSTIRIQKWFRVHQNLKILINYVDMHLMKRQNAAVEIQRIWKGFQTRRQMYEKHKWFLSCVQTIYLGGNNSKQIPIGAKLNKILHRLYESNNVNLFLKELDFLHRCIYFSYEIRKRIHEEKREWMFVQLANVVFQLNRSEQHKIYAFHVLGIIRYLTEKACFVVNDDYDADWLREIIWALIYLTNSYFNYTQLIFQSVQLLNRLVTRKIKEELAKDKRWLRLAEKIKTKYNGQTTSAPESQTSGCVERTPAKHRKVISKIHTQCTCITVEQELQKLLYNFPIRISHGTDIGK